MIFVHCSVFTYIFREIGFRILTFIINMVFLVGHALLIFETLQCF